MFGTLFLSFSMEYERFNSSPAFRQSLNSFGINLLSRYTYLESSEY